MSGVTMRRARGGFTLLEVLIAVAVVALVLTALTSMGVNAAHSAQRARALTEAVGLARWKMLEIEETFAKEGFPEQDDDEEEDFADQGHPNIRWKYTIEAVELPSLSDVQTAQGEDTPAAGSGLPGAINPTDPSQAAGASALMGQFQMVADILKAAIRRVTLVVTYKVGNKEESFTVVSYFTDPAAVDKGLGGQLQNAAGLQNQGNPPR